MEGEERGSGQKWVGMCYLGLLAQCLVVVWLVLDRTALMLATCSGHLEVSIAPWH